MFLLRYSDSAVAVGRKDRARMVLCPVLVDRSVDIFERQASEELIGRLSAICRETLGNFDRLMRKIFNSHDEAAR